MNAKEMFKRLGYKYSKSDIYECYTFIDKKNYWNNRAIFFNKSDEIVEFDYNPKLSVEELKSIQKQIEELGWE